ncbi:MAG: NAD-dependent malic enzyme [Deltaproteobacteria bacterium]|nr:NAD-dependent malic enzyme [Deltaproteobacteria bacterium]NND29315.1 NAD-dependent malic enzyme [Myxococcales bacterium]MBT8463625.1 NAD-dependent malic enzyme [Deltaproteobacteria bacterium]MBT8481406.1 NAD-dependent malic enzyme [Deltaproteobacteria bacterium]NNK06876.1 NAD-dependent malic enzyme [Myxococcales bacterium]
MPRKRISRLFDIKEDDHGRQYMEVFLDGIALLRLVLSNKGTAFSYEERVALRLGGLLPPQYNTLEQQIERVYEGFVQAPTDIDKYQYLRAVQERQEILFYALLEKHLDEMLPIVYTPTVGAAVQQFSALYQNPRGLSYSPLNIDRADQTLECYPMEDVRMIVATDSSAILGIGDQGYGGLAIPIGKMALYTVGGGVSPFHTMPVALDVGTDRMDLINDPNYLGVRQKRLRGDDYYKFLDQFVDAVWARWPDAVIQWEDLSKTAAFTVLERYRERGPSFNDDIQGTGAVALAGILAACHLRSESLKDEIFVIHGAGAGGVGVAWAIREGLVQAGLSRAEAKARVFVLDSRGLLMSDRDMEEYKRDFTHDRTITREWKFDGDTPDLVDTIRNAGATVLLGLSGRPDAFNEEVVRAMAENHKRPIIFPLSNPTSSAEAKPVDIFRWTDGKAIVATGSPFDPVMMGGVTHPIGQGNNAFIFPGLGFGAILSDAKSITDDMVLRAAQALADYTIEKYVEGGLIYPPVNDLQETSVRVATAVVQQAIADGVARRANIPEDIESFVRERFWHPTYLPFVRGHLP